MATNDAARSPPPPAPGASLTDCPQCGSLCLGANILPCGHLICRKCVRHVLQEGYSSTCASCGQHLNLPIHQGLTVNEIVRQLGTDPVMEQLVHQQLFDQGHQTCLVCDNQTATTICKDCKERYCDSCSTAHGKLGATKSHVLQTLPQALRNTSSPFPITPRHRPGPSLSNHLEDSITNPADSKKGSLSREHKEWKQWVEKMVTELRQASTDQQKVVEGLKDIMCLGQRLLEVAETEQQVLVTYADYLTGYEVTDQVSSHTYVVIEVGSDVSVEVKTETLERRLQGIRKRPQSPSFTDVESVKTQLWRFLCGLHGQEDSTAMPDFTRPASRLTMSSQSSRAGSRTPVTPFTIPQTPTPDPLTATPQRVYLSKVESPDDIGPSSISAIISLPDDRLVMTDTGNKKVKVTDLSDPPSVTISLNLDEKPLCLALLSDGLVAVTTGEPVIYLLQLTNRVTVKSQVHTSRQYIGVGGLSEGSLIVSCGQGGKFSAQVDVITRSGDIIMTVDNSQLGTQLLKPFYLCLDDDVKEAFVSDWRTNVVHRVDLSTGAFVDTVQHTHMKHPRQVCVDTAGHMYMASSGGHCVLLRSWGGLWRLLLRNRRDNDEGYVWPSAVCVTRSGRVVVVWCNEHSYSVLIAYDLK